MKILPDYEHMEYRDVYTCRTYLLLALALRARTAEKLHGEGPLTPGTRTAWVLKASCPPWLLLFSYLCCFLWLGHS